MYMEASGRQPNDKARLISPKIDGTIQSCVTFWYHMWGAQVKALNVYLAHGNTSLGSVVWTRQGNQGNRWIQGQIQITGGQAGQAITNVCILYKKSN